jgi:hypothetical protein
MEGEASIGGATGALGVAGRPDVSARIEVRSTFVSGSPVTSMIGRTDAVSGARWRVRAASRTSATSVRVSSRPSSLASEVTPASEMPQGTMRS